LESKTTMKSGCLQWVWNGQEANRNDQKSMSVRLWI
jgi:hypothetical protein